MGSIPRGLATCALLKTRLDEGKDHLGLFEPFVDDSVAHLPADHFVAAEVREDVSSRHGLTIPLETTETLLGRLKQRGVVRRDGGRWFRLAAPSATSLSDSTRALGDKIQVLGDELRTFSQAYPKAQLATTSESLDLLLTFLHEHNIALILSEEPDDSAVTLSKVQQRLIARFISHEVVRRDELRDTLGLLLEGLVLRNALLLQDLDTSASRFHDVKVYLDSNILLNLIELNGVAQCVAARETIALLRDTGAHPRAFDVTIAEVQRLFAMLEDHLSTAAGRLTLYPTPLVRHVLSQGITPGDIRVLNASLEARLRKLGIGIDVTPRRDRRYTLDEEALSRRLADATGDINQPRVRHDVDCVAGVLTLRAGRHPKRLELANALFASTSPKVIRNVGFWFRAQHEGGISPIIDFRALTNLAWLKKPASAKSLKLHELVALCAAALRPSRATWETFIANLRQMKDQGMITDDETVAIVASELADPILAEMEEDREPDAPTVQEAIERVKEAYREQGVASVRSIVTQATADTAIAREAADTAEANLRGIQARIESLSRQVGWAASLFLKVLMASLVIAMGIVAIPGVLEAVPRGLRPAAWAVIVLSFVLSFWGYWKGFTVLHLCDTAGRWVADRVTRFLRG